MLTETRILAYFAELDDPRIEKNQKHPLITRISIAILGVICGADSWVDIERYGKAKQEWLGRFLDLKTDFDPMIRSDGSFAGWMHSSFKRSLSPGHTTSVS
jgi:hypothetical protein